MSDDDPFKEQKEKARQDFETLVSKMYESSIELKIPFDAIRYLLTDMGNDTLTEMLMLASLRYRGAQLDQLDADQTTIRSQVRIMLGLDDFPVNVQYRTPINKYEIEYFFSTDNVEACFYDGSTWNVPSYCQQGDRKPKRLQFSIATNEQSGSMSYMVAIMTAAGYRPATHLEAIAFSKVYEQVQSINPYYALGTTTIINGQIFCAELGRNVKGRFLHTRDCMHIWPQNSRFLCVKK